MMADLTPDRLQELRRIAEAATPGPWQWRMSKDGRILDLITLETGYNEEIITPSHINAWLQVKGVKDFIPTFDPPTVLALLDEIERLRRELDAALDACEKARNVLALIETFDELIRTPRRRFEEAIDAIDLALLTARGEEVLATLRGEA